MRILVVTNMYPTQDMPNFGLFVKEQVELLREQGVEVEVLFINGKRSSLNYLWAIFRLWAKLLTRRYDLIHAHYVFSGIIARAQFLCPVVLTHHGLEVFTSWQRFPSRLINYLVDKVILVSNDQKEKLGLKKAEIVPCGIDTALFTPIQKEEALRLLDLPPEGKKLVLWAGDSSRPEKRWDIAKAAVSVINEKDSMVELVTVSGKPHTLVPLYMNACDVLLLVSDGEGSPMVIKEAMACNMPIVSVDVGDVAEVIRGTDGCYLCSQDPHDVAEKLLFALSRNKRTDGRNKIGYVEQGQIAKRIIDLYRDVLSKRKNGRLK